MVISILVLLRHSNKGKLDDLTRRAKGNKESWTTHEPESQRMDLSKYLEASPIIDWQNPAILELAEQISLEQQARAALRSPRRPAPSKDRSCSGLF